MTMQACDRSGWFRCKVLEYGLEEAESGSVAVKYKAQLTELCDDDAKVWNPWSQYEMESEGAVWIVKKDGKPNEKSIKSLVECCGWDGSLASIVNQTWEPVQFQGQVKADTYKDETRYRIEWLASFGATPGTGTMNSVGEDRLKALEAKYGQPLRAIAGNSARNKAPTTGKPPAPPPQRETVAAGNNEGIPF